MAAIYLMCVGKSLVISDNTFPLATNVVPVPTSDDTGAVDQRKRSESGSSTGSQSPVIRRSHQEVFIRSFLFQPELPIRIDYEAKGFKTEMVRKQWREREREEGRGRER